MLVRGLHVQYNKLEEMSVVNLEVRDLNNKENVIGQNGITLLDKMASINWAKWQEEVV